MNGLISVDTVVFRFYQRYKVRITDRPPTCMAGAAPSSVAIRERVGQCGGIAVVAEVEADASFCRISSYPAVASEGQPL
jgi:hypothetical protein